jgi:hypothetical protein
MCQVWFWLTPVYNVNVTVFSVEFRATRALPPSGVTVNAMVVVVWGAIAEPPSDITLFGRLGGRITNIAVKEKTASERAEPRHTITRCSEEGSPLLRASVVPVQRNC